MNNKIEDEIDVIKLFQKVFSEKKFIVKTLIFSTIIGIVYSLSQPNQFTSTTTFIPQLNSDIKSSGSSLSGLASLAGINLGGVNNSSEFPPTLYPKVLKSIPFKIELLESKIRFDNTVINVRDYYMRDSSPNLFSLIKKYTIGLPYLFKNSLTTNNYESVNSEIYLITEENKNLFDKISSSLTLSLNESEGFITLSFTDYDKNVAAQITLIAQKLLQDNIIDFKNKSSMELLDFALKQYQEKKIDFEDLQDKRAMFVDKNINISSSLFKNRLSRIESELNISESIVQQLASQVENAKLQVNKDTPVFTTIQPVSVPFQKSSPNRTVIVLTFIITGLIFSVGYILVKNNLLKFLKSISS